MPDDILGDFHLFWLLMAVGIALAGIVLVVVGLAIRYAPRQPATPEHHMGIAQRLSKQSIIPPWLPIDALTLDRLANYQQICTQAEFIGQGVGLVAGALGSVAFQYLLFGFASLDSTPLILIAPGGIALFLAPVVPGLLLGEGLTTILLARFLSTSVGGAPIQTTPALRWHETRYAWTLIPNTLAFLVSASVAILLIIGVIPENSAYISNGPGLGGYWVYPPAWLPLFYPLVILMIVGMGALLTRLTLKHAPMPPGVYPPYAERARKFFLVRQTFYLYLGFPAHIIGWALLGMSALASFETPVFGLGFLAALAFLLAVPIANYIPRQNPLPLFTPAELPPPPAMFAPPVAFASNPYRRIEEMNGI